MHFPDIAVALVASRGANLEKLLGVALSQCSCPCQIQKDYLGAEVFYFLILTQLTRFNQLITVYLR